MWRVNNLKKYSLLLSNEPDHEGKPNPLEAKNTLIYKKVKDMKEKWAYT